LPLPDIELPVSGATAKDVGRGRKDVEKYLCILGSVKGLSYAASTAVNDFLAVPDVVSALLSEIHCLLFC
jgi:hypothetical protein